jgi:hypothetical protein
VPLGPANNATRVLSYKTLEADPAAVRAEFKTLMRTLLDAGDDPPDVRLRQKVAAVQRECAPIHIAEFPC